jgi:hypothetical protein
MEQRVYSSSLGFRCFGWLHRESTRRCRVRFDATRLSTLFWVRDSNPGRGQADSRVRSLAAAPFSSSATPPSSSPAWNQASRAAPSSRSRLDARPRVDGRAGHGEHWCKPHSHALDDAIKLSWPLAAERGPHATRKMHNWGARRDEGVRVPDRIKGCGFRACAQFGGRTWG